MVVIGIFAGPGTLACIQRGDFPVCISETFFGSGGTQIAQGDPAQVPVAGAETDTLAAADAEPAGQPAEETGLSVSEAVLPSFALVRVEPDGGAVIAGTATPSGEVRIFADDTQIGVETAEPSGDFAFVTDEPLPAGGVELRVLDVETDTYANESVVVVVQDDRTSEPIVIASTPGEASRVLQGLESPQADAAAPAAQTETMVAATEAPAQEREAVSLAQAETPAASFEPVDPVEPAPVASVVEGPTEPATEVPGAMAIASEAAPAGTAPTETPRPETPQPEASQREASPEATEPATTAVPPIAPDTLMPQAQPPLAEDQAGEPDTGPAVVAEMPAVSEPELDPAPMGLADAEPRDSRQPAPALEADAGAEVTPVETAPEQPQETPQPSNPQQPPDAATEEPAASSDDGVVAQRAPAPQEPADVQPPLAQEDSAPEQEITVAQEEVEPVTPDAVIVQPTIDAVEIDGDRNFFAGAGTDGMTVRLYVDNELAGTTVVNDGRWLVEAIGVLDSENQRVRIDMIDASGTVVGRAEVNFVLELPQAPGEEIVVAEQAPPSDAEPPADAQAIERSAVPDAAPETAQEDVREAPQVETAPASQPVQEPEPVAEPEPIAEPIAEPAAEPEVPTMVGITEGGRTTSGLAIIRSGDNLWTIARRVYGEGIRYTQIYEANADQIRDPDLIYPGQVFDLPETNQVIGGNEEAR